MIWVLDMLNVMGFWSYGSAGCSGGRGSEISFGNHWHKMIPNASGVHEIVSGEQVGQEEQPCPARCAQGRGKGPEGQTEEC